MEKYKMIYTKNINEELEKELLYESEIMKEIKSDNIRILGHDFVKNNKYKAKLIINNKKYKLKEFINGKEFKDDKINISIILSKGLSNISHIFDKCVKLIELSIYESEITQTDEDPYKYFECKDNFNMDNNENTIDSNVNSQNNLFKNLKENDKYSNSSTITYISKTYENNESSTISNIKDNIVTNQYFSNMSFMFYNCRSLSSLPDISYWNTNKATNMIGMFGFCTSLISLPDISEWNTNNVINMLGIFSNC